MDYPYEVPTNWEWVRLSSVANVIMGQSPEGTSITDDSSCIPLIGGATDMGELSPLISRYTDKATKLSEKGDIILCIRATLGRPIFSDGVYCLGRGVASIRTELGLKEFWRYVLINFEQYLYDKATGSTFAQVTSNVLRNMPIPLAPLPEQHRIVARIESLFSKLDEAKEKAQSVLDGFENRRAAILHKAFTGELTKKWRDERSMSFENWRNACLGEVVSGFKYGSSEKSDYANDGTPVLRIPNIDGESINFVDMKYFNHKNIDETYRVHENDVLIIRSNGSRDLVGKCSLVPHLKQEYAYASFLIKIIPSDRINPAFLVKYLNSADAREQMFSKVKSSAGIHNINSQELGAIKIPVPTLNEQLKIVRILDRLLSQEQQAKQAAEAVIAQIDVMKKSILARAFRGELGTNDPSDEPARI